jgi:hypothetical protein
MWTVFTCKYMLSIRWTSFHRWLSIRGNVKKWNISAELNTIFKNLVLQALGTIRVRQKIQKILSCLCTFKGPIQTGAESAWVYDVRPNPLVGRYFSENNVISSQIVDDNNGFCLFFLFFIFYLCHPPDPGIYMYAHMLGLVLLLCSLANENIILLGP